MTGRPASGFLGAWADRPVFPGAPQMTGDRPDWTSMLEDLAAEGAQPVLVTGMVESVENGLATVLVGPEQEEWDFPFEILPDDVEPGSVLILERWGRRLRFVEIDPVSEMARRREFDLRMRRTAHKLPFMASRDGG